MAPFKAQNMALNSFVTPSGHEIGRAQGVQALAAGVEPEVDMNPILLKPSSDRTSQVIVLGAPTGHLDAVAYHAAKPTFGPRCWRRSTGCGTASTSCCSRGPAARRRSTCSTATS